jgi:hypothetical protein
MERLAEGLLQGNRMKTTRSQGTPVAPARIPPGFPTPYPLNTAEFHSTLSLSLRVPSEYPNAAGRKTPKPARTLLWDTLRLLTIYGHLTRLRHSCRSGRRGPANELATSKIRQRRGG